MKELTCLGPSDEGVNVNGGVVAKARSAKYTWMAFICCGGTILQQTEKSLAVRELPKNQRHSSSGVGAAHGRDQCAHARFANGARDRACILSVARAAMSRDAGS